MTPLEAWAGIEPACADLQSAASPLRHQAAQGDRGYQMSQEPAIATALHRLREARGANYKAPVPVETLSLTADFAAARQIMVDSQIRTQDVTDVALLDALRAFPRESVVPSGKIWAAYADAEVEYAPGRWLLRPRDVAKLLQSLRPIVAERALAISAPYAGAILGSMGLQVVSSDAAATPPVGPWDVIVCEGAVGRVPEAWMATLADGGRLGAVERDGPVGRARLYLRTGEVVGRRELFDSTPPILSGFAPERGFVL